MLGHTIGAIPGPASCRRPRVFRPLAHALTSGDCAHWVCCRAPVASKWNCSFAAGVQSPQTSPNAHQYDTRTWHGEGHGEALPNIRGGAVFRLFPPCALISHAQGSSSVVDNMPFTWRGHTKRLTTRARPSPDLPCGWNKRRERERRWRRCRARLP